MTRRNGQPRGRPPSINRLLATRDDGTTETVADRIIAHVQAGNYIEEAAGAAGVNKVTVYDWLKRGARAQAHLAAGKPKAELSRLDRQCAEFTNAVASADAVATARDVAQTARLAQGIERTIETVKLVPKVAADGTPIVDAKGQPVLVEVERTTRKETAVPDGAMLRWRLERRKPHKFGRLNRVEVTGLDGAPVQVQSIDEKRDVFLERLATLAANMADNPEADLDGYVLDADSVEVHQHTTELGHGNGTG